MTQEEIIKTVAKLLTFLGEDKNVFLISKDGIEMDNLKFNPQIIIAQLYGKNYESRFSIVLHDVKGGRIPLGGEGYVYAFDEQEAVKKFLELRKQANEMD